MIRKNIFMWIQEALEKRAFQQYVCVDEDGEVHNLQNRLFMMRLSVIMVLLIFMGSHYSSIFITVVLTHVRELYIELFLFLVFWFFFFLVFFLFCKQLIIYIIISFCCLYAYLYWQLLHYGKQYSCPDTVRNKNVRSSCCFSPIYSQYILVLVIYIYVD